MGERRRSTPERYLALVTVFRNEARYLPEWVEFHRLVGFERIYLYDNASTDDFRSALARFVEDDFVTVIPWGLPWSNRDLNAQHLAYAHAIWSFGGQWRWMAFLDIDEFLFPVKVDDLKEVLRDYEDLPALAAHWAMFGYSGHQSPPPGLVIENFTMRAPWPTHALSKSIVDPSQLTTVSGAHLFGLGGQPTYDEDRRPTRVRQRQATGNRVIRLHHYFTKSRDEFAARLRPRGKNPKKPDGSAERTAEEIEASPEFDPAILRFVPELKRRMSPTTD